MARSNKADEKQLKQIEKAVAKADEAVKKAAREAADEAKAKADEAKAKEAAREAKAAKAQARKEHGVEKIEGKSKSWWSGQTRAIIKQEAELRGHRFTDTETKGVPSTVKGVKTKINKFKKEDYLKVLFKILKL